MSRRDDLSPDDRRIWARVAGSVTPAQPKKAALIMAGPAAVEPPAAPHPKATPKERGTPPSYTPSMAPGRPRGLPEELEPRRQRRLSRERDPIEARIDLHGFGRFQAQDALTAFLLGAQARGYRSVLVITGQGRRGGTGVIRASVHEWLQSPALRGVVSGYASAARHHGGDGALYVTVRRA
ncbi:MULTISPECIES: Smr/MutS family protein [unclassified Brevundimonas]|uniref:Smr/MutS family protein n=1 Tax=unclassified Brevundimonas TaxID=2622653 RepID=UPI0006F40F9D|nr:MULTISPECIES: Smr/MutS family protein [unclassified Brevundimonas]KQY62361.1 DNA mismatch repair protein MutS [Brevundimonas sp. Root1423]KRA21764.1 DNA mismatch repair protein MutS [Brevundimonas sp. Root608]